MTIEQAIPILQDVIKFNKLHADYKRTVELATLYRQLITGKDQASLIIQFVRRENPEMFQQRLALTHTITPAVAESIMNEFYRLGRLGNAKKIIDYPEDNEKAINEINDRLNTFWGEEPLEKYLGTKYTQLSFLDPNAWIVTDFDNFNPFAEKARPYPVEYASDQAIDFRLKNNKTEYLIIKKPIVRTFPDGTKLEGFKYLMYLENDILEYTQVLEKATGTVNGLPVIFLQNNSDYWQADSSRRFLFAVYRPKGGEVQAIRVGYKGDPETDSRTFVNPFHPALAFFMKTIKAVSEMDLTSSLHVFPQKLQYVEECEGEETKDFGFEHCSGGRLLNGKVCGTCKGSGVKVVTTAQDAITLPMPDLKKTAGGQYMKLDDILIYKAPPVELLTFQKEYIRELRVDAMKAVFNTGALTELSIEKTATEVMSNKDPLNNTLQPFAEHYSTVWKKQVRLIAAFTDNKKDLRVIHEFPEDLKLETIEELLNSLKKAVDSGAPSFLIQQLNKSIASKIFADDPIAFSKFIVKNRFVPFLGKSEEDIRFIITSGYCTKEERVLHTHTDSIFDEIELEQPEFFSFTYEKQIPVVDAKVNKILEKLAAEQPAALGMDFSEEVNDVNAEAQANLRGSVGGVQGILEIQKSVAEGITEYAAGLAMLASIYGYEDDKAREILGTPKIAEAVLND